MGEIEGWVQSSGIYPNGLLPDAGPLIQVLEPDRWLKAEERTAELIARIQPNPPSEERRNAVADYVQRLIKKCLPCQVFTYGSVPLKTYLPDGDIDLTAFSEDQNLKETWASQVRDMLESEEKDANAEFRVKEVQFIQAEVKIIKCLVENIVVDISFNQVGGLCTLCFLEEVDQMINRNHLFKRSIILIKAWCYYESRILGAHHGLISTYALETLVLYIFHIFNNSFAGPLEVLYRFLEFFSNFDWDNFCVSLWGPVSVSSLPNITAESPRKDSGDLLLSKSFLDDCSFVYAVFPGGQENHGQAFVPKHFNIIDPLRINNNLGRSVSKGNFYRIRSAFAFGAKKLARLLDCPKESLLLELNQFFMNTWERHGSGVRPDAPEFSSALPSVPYQPDCASHKDSSRTKKLNENPSSRETKVGDTHSRSISSKRGNISDKVSRINGVSTQSQKSHGNLNSQRISDQIVHQISLNQGTRSEKGQINLQSKHLLNDIQGRFFFARTRSSPELTDTSDDVSYQDRHTRVADSANYTQKTSSAESNSYHRNRRKNTVTERSQNHTGRSMSDDTPSVRHDTSYPQRPDPAVGLNSESESRVMNELSSTVPMQGMHQEEQEIVNMMGSSRIHGINGVNGQVHMPLNFSPGHLPFPISPSILASMGYAPQNFAGMVPTNFPLVDHSFPHTPFPHGFIPPQLNHYFSGVGVTSNSEGTIDPVNENASSTETTMGEADHEYWQEHDASPTGALDSDNGNIAGEMAESTSSDCNFVPSRINGPGFLMRGQQKNSRKMQGSMQEDCLDNFQFQDNRGNEINSDEKATSSRVSSVARSSSLRSKTSSESSWEEPSIKVSKSTREKRGKKTATAEPSTWYGKNKMTTESLSVQPEDDDEDWNRVANMSSEMTERNSETAPSVSSLHAARHHVLPGYESVQTSESEPMIPMSPIVLGPGAGQRMMDKPGVLPLAFYPTGPPVPFLTMLPVYNVPPNTRTSDASSRSHYGGEEVLHGNDPGQMLDSLDRNDYTEDLNNANSLGTEASPETSDEQKPDILNSDFSSHWQNLQFGRFCQNPKVESPGTYPSPVIVPPMHLQGRVPWDGPGRPLSGNMNQNVYTQLMGYGPRIVPVPVQSVTNRPPNVYQHDVDDLPRYRSGTGTYLPNHVSARDRHPSGTRRGNYNYDRSEGNDDKEGNWNSNSKSRPIGRNHNRNQTEKSSSRFDRPIANENRTDNRSRNSYRHDTYPANQSQNGPLHSNSSQGGPHPDVAYGIYSAPVMNPSGLASNGPTAPSVVMLYPYDHNPNYDPNTDPHEYGNVGTADFSGINGQSHSSEGTRARGVYEERRFQGSYHSSPDQPSSPRHHRRI